MCYQLVPLLSGPANARSNPFAVQRVHPLSLLGDEDHAAPLLLLLALPQSDLCIANCHHPLLHCAYTHAAAGARQGSSPGDGGFRWKVPGRRQGVNKLKASNADNHRLIHVNSSCACYLSAWVLVGVPHSDPCSEEMEMMDCRMDRSMERGRVDFLSSMSGCKENKLPILYQNKKTAY